uniref:Secreted protein n=1 Tax=Rhizophora mucronata TaxID=61149 RepID=A0A2P2PVF5_RHIMU
MSFSLALCLPVTQLLMLILGTLHASVSADISNTKIIDCRMFDYSTKEQAKESQQRILSPSILSFII